MNVFLAQGSVAVSAATAKTIGQYAAAAASRAKLKGYRFSARSGTSTDAPGQINISTQTTAGTMSAGTLVARDPGDSAGRGTFQTNATAEPTTTTAIEPLIDVAPQGAPVIYDYPYGDEPVIAASGRVGLIATFPQAQTVDFALVIQE